MREIKWPWMAAEVLVWRAGWMRGPFPEMEDIVAVFGCGGVGWGVCSRQDNALPPPNPWDL